MRSLVEFAGLLVVCLVPWASAQPLHVEASVPSNGQAGVALVDTVRFTFSAPLDPGAAESALVLFSPTDGIEVDYADATISPDGFTLLYPVVHDAETDFVAVVVSAHSADGEALDIPYAINYTTAASHGTRNVGGVVSTGVPPSPSPRGSIVGLVDLGTLEIAAAAVVQTDSGAYQIEPVRSGAYIAFAILVPDVSASRPLMYGFYDADGNGEPDPIFVLFSNPTGIDITLVAPEPVTARHRLDDALATAADSAPDQDLVAVYALPVDTLGRAPMWVYEFHSASQSQLTRVIPTDLIDLTQTFEQLQPPGETIDLDFVDSDVALAAAESVGGSDFRIAHPDAIIGADGRTADKLDEYQAPVWRVAYRAGEQDSLIVFVDMATGQVIEPVSTEPISDSWKMTLDHAFPNPFSREVTIGFQLEEGAHVSLRAFDLLGRQVAIIQDQPFSAGSHEARWTPPPNLSSGTYVLRLDALDLSLTQSVRYVRR